MLSLFHPVLQSHTSAPIFGNVIMPSTPTPLTSILQLFLDSPYFNFMLICFFCQSLLHIQLLFFLNLKVFIKKYPQQEE